MKIIILVFLLSTLPIYSGVVRDDVPIEQCLNLANEPQFDCVGQIMINGKKGASCVLISRKYVLCAGHSLSEKYSIYDTTNQKGEQIIKINKRFSKKSDITNYTFKFKDKEYKGIRLLVYPDYLESRRKSDYDLAIVELEKEVTNVNIPVINRSFDELNSDVVTVGFGPLSNGNHMKQKKLYGFKNAGWNCIDSIGGSKNMDGKHVSLIADFDHPIDTICCNKCGSNKPVDLEFTTTGGDSGGGLFRLSNGVWELIGITSGNSCDVTNIFKYGNYGSASFWVRLSVLIPWIESAMKKQNND